MFILEIHATPLRLTKYYQQLLVSLFEGGRWRDDYLKVMTEGSNEEEQLIEILVTLFRKTIF